MRENEIERFDEIIIGSDCDCITDVILDKDSWIAFLTNIKRICKISQL